MDHLIVARVPLGKHALARPTDPFHLDGKTSRKNVVYVMQGVLYLLAGHRFLFFGGGAAANKIKHAL